MIMILSATIFKPICHLLKCSSRETKNRPRSHGENPAVPAVAQCDHQRARSVIVPGLFPAFPGKATQTPGCGQIHAHQSVVAQ